MQKIARELNLTETTPTAGPINNSNGTLLLACQFCKSSMKEILWIEMPRQKC